jgi:hypothetical protein
MPLAGVPLRRDRRWPELPHQPPYAPAASRDRLSQERRLEPTAAVDGIIGEHLVEPFSEARVPPQVPAEVGNKSCCAQSRAAYIAGLRTAPLPAQSSPASQQSGDGGLPGKKIALDLQQIVDHLLRIRGRRRLAAAPEQLPRTPRQLLLPVLIIVG